ncbi:unnamed protein product [Clavelina lepadiformis]|uniref:CUB domain-containing protein n=1 Tax=Clavelina lepadiformis TaxID=159417 RepID=A0ABP0FRW8_CLALP
MFVGFLILVLVGMLGAEVDAQCTGNSKDFTDLTSYVTFSSSCSESDVSVTRSVSGRTFGFVEANTFSSVPPEFQCSFYNGTSTSDQLLATIGISLAGLVELFENSANAFIQCFGTGTTLFFSFFTVPSSNVFSEVFEDVPLIKVQSPNFPQDYPVDYIQETVIKSNQSTTYTVSFNSTFDLYDDLLSIISDEGTGMGFFDTSKVPAPFNITGKEIKIQFASDGSVTETGFQITFEAIPTTPPAANELFCDSQGHVNISLSTQTVNDLCGNDDGYVIISATPVEDVNSVDPECRADSSDPNFNLDLSKCSILKLDKFVAIFMPQYFVKLNKYV